MRYIPGNRSLFFSFALAKQVKYVYLRNRYKKAEQSQGHVSDKEESFSLLLSVVSEGKSFRFKSKTLMQFSPVKRKEFDVVERNYRVSTVICTQKF